MEEELLCPQCGSFYQIPVLLVCKHSLCFSCAASLQRPISGTNNHAEESCGSVYRNGEDHHENSDKLSLVSDADSGVSCSSRPTSLVGAVEAVNNTDHVPPPTFVIDCPSCKRETPLDGSGVESLPRFRVMAAVVDKHLDKHQLSEPCQLCEGEGSPRPAKVFCDQCLVFYCGPCRESCHPPRGPLAAHWLVGVSEGRALLRARRREQEGRCPQHMHEQLSMFCTSCSVPVCLLCLHNGRHHSHDVQALNALTKVHKTELSQSLQQLSEKARAATDFIHTLKTLGDDVHLRVLRDQVNEYTHTLQATTATIQFCIEALKESDPASFMEAHSVLEDRVTNTSQEWQQTMVPEPRVMPAFDLTLDDKTLLLAIQQLTFIQLKPPGPPSFVVDECSAENNSITVAWAAHPSSCVSGYSLQLDDGANGPFREVYMGAETVCTIDGLHFNSLYRARVRAFNSTGNSLYSEPLCLQTAEVAWFRMEPGHTDLDLSKEGMVVTCDSYEHRVALGSVGFSRGSHYWEFSIKRYDGYADIAFGVARFDVNKELILGKSSASWSMYIDGQRSWLMHGGEHFGRTQGGVSTGHTVGIWLNFIDHTLTFFVNNQQQGCMSLTGQSGILYPAVSLDRSVTLVLHSGIKKPNGPETSIPESHQDNPSCINKSTLKTIKNQV
ncbi:E3 ubiquitin-protein ligase TRIM9-like isoform X2 [Oratosquilla oratoria]|uniref:E3 ubiquitin-protein ligase TRIM9-like isoform X2 n=1 Tax=Oratosquilla oratoria TaxID=337810 RepID=UPI003F77220A